MRFLIDEMFGAEVAVELVKAGHDGMHLAEAGLIGASDADVLARAVADDRVLVTENGPDFLMLLDQRSALGLALTPVVVALKRRLGRGATMNRALADRLVRWATDNPDPYRHVHWLP